MFYYLYQITNKVNNKIYVGVHKTKDLNDGYMGSGKVIRSAIMKHGIENFKKDILETFENAEVMYAREAEVVTDEFLLREDVYNLRRGGHGGFDYINENSLNGFSNIDTAKLGRKITNEKLVLKYGSLSEFAAKGGKASRDLKTGIHDPLHRKMYSDAGNSPEARAKASITLKATLAERRPHDGEKNSQYGTMWITNEVDNKKIKKTDSIPDGYRKGRNQAKGHSYIGITLPCLG